MLPPGTARRRRRPARTSASRSRSGVPPPWRCGDGDHILAVVPQVPYDAWIWSLRHSHSRLMQSTDAHTGDVPTIASVPVPRRGKTHVFDAGASPCASTTSGTNRRALGREDAHLSAVRRPRGPPLGGRPQALGNAALEQRRDALAQLRPLSRVPNGGAMGRRAEACSTVQHPLVADRDRLLALRSRLRDPAGRRSPSLTDWSNRFGAHHAASRRSSTAARVPRRPAPSPIAVVRPESRRANLPTLRRTFSPARVLSMPDGLLISGFN